MTETHSRPPGTQSRPGRHLPSIATLAGVALGLTFVIGFATGRATAGEPSDRPIPTSAEQAVEHAKRKGDTAPDVSLTNTDGEEVKLEKLYAEQPLVVTFYRGSWCPYCTGSLKKFEDARDRIEAAGGTLIAVSPEEITYLKQNKRKHSFGFDVYSDDKLEAGHAFGVAFKNASYQHLPKFNGPGDYEIPLGATYIIDTDGEIVWSFIEEDYRKRADPADVVSALNEIAG